MFVEQYGIAFLKAMTAEIVREMMTVEIFHEMSASIYRWYLGVGKITLRHLCLMYVGKELDKRLPCS